MKNINIKKILTVVLWIIGLSGLFFSLAFATEKEKQVVTQNVIISVSNTDVHSFIDEQDLKDFLKQKNEVLLNSKVKDISVNHLEKELNTHPDVENAEVAVDINGDVTIDVKQRTPLVRVLNRDGESYYIDDQSKLMPLSEKYTARVLIATGYIFEPYAQRYTISVDNIAKNKLFSEVSLLDDIYALSTYISKDSVLNALIHQINITKNKEVELYPSIGNHIILFGRAADIEEKFNKLKLFYTEGLNKTNSWNKYSIINVKYKNQVVCTKR